MKFKKAQGEIITTVLIILLVLAAIVIVWQVVNNTVKKGGEQIQTQGGCVGVVMKVTAASETSVTVQRETGGTAEGVNYVILVDGIVKSTTNTPATLKQLESGNAILADALTANKKVKVAAKVGDVSCGLSEEFTIPAA